MKHWRNNKRGFYDKDTPGIHIPEARVLSIYKLSDGSINFREDCDEYFSVTLSKEQAKELLLEALEWIES
jgi:hypothetical protein